MIETDVAASPEIMRAEGDPIEAHRIRAEVRFRLFGGTPPKLLIGRFELGTRLGAGGMGVVYAGRDPDLARAVAIKVLFAQSDAELRREAQALAKLRHPNVVSVHEIGSWQDLPFVAMELVDGATLRAWLAEQPRTWQEIAAVFAAAGRGLAAAHAAGLVHRDFKLENVLVDREGQARVVDFGLARPAGDHDALPRSTRLDAKGTTATAAGTPAYMAPEVLRGEPATARSDQFSFGVALYEALTGARPHEARDVDGLIAAAAKRPAKIAGIPKSIEAALERCLSPLPADRYPDLAPVIDALAPTGGSRPPWFAIIGVVAILALITLVATSSWRRDPEPAPIVERCADAGMPLAKTWNDGNRVAIKAAFSRSSTPEPRSSPTTGSPTAGSSSLTGSSTGSPTAPGASRFAGDMAARAIAGLDAYASRWMTAATDACRATLPETVMALRTTCLDDRRRQLAAMIDRLTNGDAKAVERSVAAISALPSVESCADTSVLAERMPLPQDVIVVSKIAAGRDRLAAARALFLSGNSMDAKAAVAKLAVEVDAIAYAPLTAETQLLLGLIAGQINDLATSEPALERAYREGIAGRHDPAAAEAAIKLAHLVGHVKAKPGEGRPWVANAEALLRRIGGAHELEAQLGNSVGNIEQTAGRYDLAIAAFDKAERAWRDAPGDHRIDIAQMLHNGGNARMLSGKAEDALPKLRASLALLHDAVGPDHPYIAMTTTALTGAMRDLGDYTGALELDERILANEIARFGDDHPEVAFARGAVGNDLRGLAKYEQAIVHLEKAGAIFAATFGPDHPTAASTDSNVGAALMGLGRYDEAEKRMTKALAAKAKRGDKHPSLISTLDNLGTLALRRGRGAEAKKLFERSLAIGEAAAGKDSPDVAITLGALGEAVLATGDAAGAKKLLERALALRAKSRAEDVAPTKATLGRAVWQLGDRAGGHRLVTEALAKLTQPMHRYERAEAQRWLQSHPAP